MQCRMEQNARPVETSWGKKTALRPHEDVSDIFDRGIAKDLVNKWISNEAQDKCERRHHNITSLSNRSYITAPKSSPNFHSSERVNADSNRLGIRSGIVRVPAEENPIQAK